LRDILREPQMLQFAQRISSDFHLRPLQVKEVREYIDFRLRAVGSQRELFTEEACEIVAKVSHGIPRTINILCDTALVYGFAREAERISPELIDLVVENKAQFGVLPFGLQPV
jgi:general secretion pathway protein A